ncbi:carbohydrate ABC transporter permease [uncultured Acetatifactor sp.]|uniref:carbohydrate ABC transporter permease n=1 Tax=uncultured Acetatifactor sp. TaxID=1671927 RepID=UPI002628D7C7|nr:carbohydrate ABC transporter permease [uncultured Acetatifactor sp.]
MKKRILNFFFYVICILLCLIFLFPFVVMLFGSLDGETKYAVTLTSWFPTQFSLKQYQSVLSVGGRMSRWVLNSVIISVIPTITGVFLDALLGYIFAKKRFPGRQLIFWYFMAAIMVPYQATIVSNYLLYSWLGWINTYWAFLIPGMWTVLYMFMMRQNIAAIPDALLEAARIDGAGEWRTFLQIVLPVSKPGLSTVAIFSFMNNWNNFMGPLIFTTSEKMYNLVVGLSSLNQQSASFNMQMTAGVITFIPMFLVYMAFQKYFVDGITVGSVKG